MGLSGRLSTKSIDHLGLVSGMCDELGIVDVIDTHIPQDLTQRNISIGTICKALVLNGLGFSQRRLYLTPDFFKDKPIELLLGKGIVAEHLNDSVLGRCLDRLYETGVTKLFTNISVKACGVLGLDRKIGHMDSTTFALHGKAYDSLDSDAVVITHGYSRDHRPDLPQVVLNMICEHKAGIPTFMAAVSGNKQDKELFRETIGDHISNLQPIPGLKLVISDSAGYTSHSITEQSEHLKWISRVPQRIKQCQTLIQETHVTEMQILDNTNFYRPFSSDYAGVAQRWILVFSEDAFRREVHTLKKHFSKKSSKENGDFIKLCKLNFDCPEDARQHLERFKKACQFITLTDVEIAKTAKYSRKGRPKKGSVPDSFTYTIRGSVSCSLKLFAQKKSEKGKFIIATNELDEQELTDQQVIESYKNQTKIERGFRFMKDKQFMASTMFVKKPERIEALLFIMTICLMVYAAIEYRIRKQLQQNNKSFPNQVGKPTPKPTTRWIFSCFRGITVLYGLAEVQILNLQQHQIEIIEMLGHKYKKYYFRE